MNKTFFTEEYKLKPEVNTKPNYFPALTGVRAIAAYMVCICHFNPFTERVFGLGIHNFFNEFHVGVTLFFVLSGFLITYRYYEHEKINFKHYFVNRFARIYPVYFILTTVVMAIYALQCHCQTIKSFSTEYFMNISFLRGFFNDYIFTGIMQGWSLTIEEVFYLSAPIIFFLVKKDKKYLLYLPLIFLAVGYFLYYMFRNTSFGGFFNNWDFMISYSFFGRSIEFFVGIGLALAYLKKEKQDKRTNTKGYFTYLGATFIIICILIISLFCGEQLGIKHPISKIINNFVLPLGGIAVFYWGLITENTIISKFLSTKWMIFLGKISYVFYLIHIQVGQINDNIIFVSIVSILLSSFIYKLIEEPLNIYLRKIWIKPKMK